MDRIDNLKFKKDNACKIKRIENEPVFAFFG